MDGTDRTFDFLAAGVFGEVAPGAGLQGGEERLVVGVGREDDDLSVARS
jgi:hypothetical protein